MQELRIILVGQAEDEAKAQQITDAIADTVSQFDGMTVYAAPWAKDLSAARKAEYAAEQAQIAADKAAADTTAIEAITAALSADPTLTDEQKASIAITIGTAVGKPVVIGPAPINEDLR
jgi:hypothetical protein